MAEKKESDVFDFNTFVKEELNTEQRKAVKNSAGPLLVIAGAGSGKTRVITARITNLLRNEQVHPAQIISLTFTNKAANEMKERIKKFLGSDYGMPFVGTFHSYCLYLLKTNTHLIGWDQFSILDEDDKRSLLTKILKKSPLYQKQTPQQVSYAISLAKNQCSSLSDYLKNNIENEHLHEVIQEYEKEKKKSKCFDFDDLLLETVKLFENEEFKQDHHYQVRHVLVDEYQDTNIIQHSLLKHMAAAPQKGELAIDSLCVVGDEDQSIYSWRGATVDNIIHFKKDFKKTVQIKIEQNYRSKKPILAIANKVIAHNKNRNEKKLWSDKPGRDCVRILQCLSGYQEADIIARYCKILENNKSLGSTAILYRTHFQSRVLEEALIKQSISYNLVGGVRFYERKEIKDILAYLRLIINPFDRVAFMRVINCPSRGLGDKFLEEFMALWDTELFLNFKEIIAKIIPTLPPLKQESVKEFVKLFHNTTPQAPAAEIMAEILTGVGYLMYVKKSYEKQEAEERQANIKELLNAAHFFAQQGKVTIEQFLDEVALLVEQTAVEVKGKEPVTMMTLHAAKGLEFDHVIIPGIEENLFPSPRSINEINALEEERRLFYVGITRARNRLLLTHARYRQTYGQMEEAAPSRFLHEVPSQYAQSERAAAWQHYEVTTYFSRWLGFASANPEVMTFSQFKPPASVVPIKATPLLKGGFKQHQTIKHKTFGIGIIKEIEQKQSKTFVTAQFKIGIKKIDSKFIQTI